MALGVTKKEKIDGLAESAGVSLAASAWKRLRRSPVFLIGATIIGIFVALSLLSPWLAPHNPSDPMLIEQVVKARNEIPPPQPGHPLGGDLQGRDFLSRLLVGSQQTLIVGVGATLIGLAGGLILGTLAGALGGWVDSVVMRIVDVMPRPSAHPDFPGRAFGSNAAAWWGFHYGDLLTEPKPREVITIYEVDATGAENWAKAVYNYRWTPQTDPYGVVHPTIARSTSKVAFTSDSAGIT